MIKMTCSNEKCRHVWFDEEHNTCPKCAKKAKISEEDIEKMERVLRNKKPYMK